MANDQKNPTTELSEGLCDASSLEWVNMCDVLPHCSIEFPSWEPSYCSESLCGCAADSEFEVRFPHLSVLMIHADMRAGCKMTWLLKCKNNNKKNPHTKQSHFVDGANEALAPRHRSCFPTSVLICPLSWKKCAAAWLQGVGSEEQPP